MVYNNYALQFEDLVNFNKDMLSCQDKCPYNLKEPVYHLSTFQKHLVACIPWDTCNKRSRAYVILEVYSWTHLTLISCLKEVIILQHTQNLAEHISMGSVKTWHGSPDTHERVQQCSYGRWQGWHSHPFQAINPNVDMDDDNSSALSEKSEGITVIKSI